MLILALRTIEGWVCRIGMPITWDYGPAQLAIHVDLFVKGAPLYRDFRIAPCIPLVYGPIVPSLTGKLAPMFGAGAMAALEAGRSVTIGSTLIVCVMIFILRGDRIEPWRIVAGGAGIHAFTDRVAMGLRISRGRAGAGLRVHRPGRFRRRRERDCDGAVRGELLHQAGACGRHRHRSALLLDSGPETPSDYSRDDLARAGDRGDHTARAPLSILFAQSIKRGTHEKPRLGAAALFLTILFGGNLGITIFAILALTRRRMADRMMLCLLIVAAVHDLASCLRWGSNAYYFLPLLAALSIIASAGIDLALEWMRSWAAIRQLGAGMVLALLLAFGFIFTPRPFAMSWREIVSPSMRCDVAGAAPWDPRALEILRATNGTILTDAAELKLIDERENLQWIDLMALTSMVELGSFDDKPLLDVIWRHQVAALALDNELLARGFRRRPQFGPRLPGPSGNFQTVWLRASVVFWVSSLQFVAMRSAISLSSSVRRCPNTSSYLK